MHACIFPKFFCWRFRLLLRVLHTSLTDAVYTTQSIRGPLTSTFLHHFAQPSPSQPTPHVHHHITSTNSTHQPHSNVPQHPPHHPHPPRLKPHLARLPSPRYNPRRQRLGPPRNMRLPLPPLLPLLQRRHNLRRHRRGAGRSLRRGHRAGAEALHAGRKFWDRRKMEGGERGVPGSVWRMGCSGGVGDGVCAEGVEYEGYAEVGVYSGE